jgi:hypothetical protein
MVVKALNVTVKTLLLLVQKQGILVTDINKIRRTLKSNRYCQYVIEAASTPGCHLLLV